MALRTQHPLYQRYSPDWEQMNDTYQGERTIKEKAEKYLPPTSAHRLDGYPTANSPGHQDYLAYKLRAVFPDYTRDAVERLVGLMHKKPPVIEVPPQLTPMLERMTADGETAQQLLRRINEMQLRTGRLGLLLDAPTGQGPDALPYISVYEAPAIINWNSRPTPDGGHKLSMVVMDESEPVMDENTLEWTNEEKFRIVRIVEGASAFDNGIDKGDGNATTAQFIQPSIKGKSLDEVPFVFCNAMDTVPDPARPPLLGLSNICLTIYRGEADYRQALFMQGQETLVVIGAKLGGSIDGAAEEDSRVGAGARLDVPVGGDAKYIGVSAAGLSEQRQALENDREQADKAGASILNFTDPNESSGVALETRTAANTASAVGLARTGAEALAKILRLACKWVGANPEDVKVEPNTDFVDVMLTSADLLGYVTAKQSGAPISWRTIHKIMEEKDLTELTFEDELEQIAEETTIPELSMTPANVEVDPETGERIEEDTEDENNAGPSE